MYVKNQINLLSFLSACFRTTNIHQNPNSSLHPHRSSYLPCLCVWCCWPPLGSPGVFYASPGDRTPCVVVDCDDEDLKKSRFAVQLRRPSFSSLLLDAWAAFAFKSPRSVFLRSVAVQMSPWRRRKRFRNCKIRLFLADGGGYAACFSVVRRACREMLRRDRKKETVERRMISSKRKKSENFCRWSVI